MRFMNSATERPETLSYEAAKQIHERAKIQLADVQQRMGAASVRRAHLVKQHQKLPIIGKIDRVDHSGLLNEAQEEMAQLDLQMAELRAMQSELTQRVKAAELEQNRAELHELLTVHEQKRLAEIEAKQKFAAAGLTLIDAAQTFLNAQIERQSAQKRIALLAQTVRYQVKVPPALVIKPVKFDPEWLLNARNAGIGRREMQKLASMAHLI